MFLRVVDPDTLIGGFVNLERFDVFYIVITDDINHNEIHFLNEGVHKTFLISPDSEQSLYQYLSSHSLG